MSQVEILGCGTKESIKKCMIFGNKEQFAIECNEQTERFIWRIFSSEEIKEINLPLGTYKEVIQSLLDWFHKTYPKTS